MSDDETFVFLIATMAAVLLWGHWVFICLAVQQFGRGKLSVAWALLVPIACCGLLFGVLRTAASHDVRDAWEYLAFYVACGTAWLGVVMRCTGLCGLSLRDDWIERRNPAAAAQGTGFLLGAMAAFAGANIGDGPGWWVVVFSASLSTGALFAAWAFVALLTPVSEHVTIERDFAAGLRAGGFLLTTGVIAGRSAAGDWVSASATLADFAAKALPLVPYVVAVILVENFLLRAPGRPRFWANGGMWLVLHLGVAVAYLQWAGSWK